MTNIFYIVSHDDIRNVVLLHNNNNDVIIKLFKGLKMLIVLS